MKQSEMLKELKELRSDLMRYAAGSDSIVPGAYAEALDAAIETLDRIRWRNVEDELPEKTEFLFNEAHVLKCVRGYIPDGYHRFIAEGYCRLDHVDAWGNTPNTYTTHWAYLPELPEEEDDT